MASPAASGRFGAGLGDQDWSGAQWIRRTTAGNDASNDYTLARTSVTIGASPVVRARAYVAAMADWELHVDGTVVDKTSSAGYPGEGYYDVSDITSQAVAGQPLTLGVRYHYWTCTCQGRANGPVAPEGPSGILESLLGVTVAGAGASSVQVQPPLAGLTHAEGTEWTERGPITVSWRHAGPDLIASVTVPVNVTATVVLGSTRITVGSGTHHLAAHVG